MLCSSIFIIPLINEYIVYAEEPQSNASNTDNIATQADIPNVDDSTATPNVEDSTANPSVEDSTANPSVDDSSSGSGSHNTQSENSNATSSGVISPEGTPESTSTIDNSLGSVVTDGEQTAESGTFGSLPEEQSDISSGSAEQTGNTETNQSSTIIQSETGTGVSHDSKDGDGDNTLSFTAENLTGPTSSGLESPSPVTTTTMGINQSSQGLSSTTTNQSASGSSVAVISSNQSATGSSGAVAINESSSSAIEFSTSTSALSNESSVNTSSEDSSSKIDATDTTTNPNVVVRPISAGSEQEINFGDVSNTENTTAKISLDKSSYAVGDTAKVTVNDPDANLDSSVINTVQVLVTSDFVPDGILVTLTETSPDSGIFEGTFGFTNDGGPGDLNSIGLSPEDPNAKIKLFYDASLPRAKVVITGVEQNGTAEVKDILLGNQIPTISPLTRVGVNLSLADGAQLIPPTDPVITQLCDTIGNASAHSCGGSITITMSYANIPLTFERAPDEGCGENCTVITETVSPSNLTIYERVGETWIPLDQHGPVTIDQNSKTVTATSPFGPGIFILSIKAPPSSDGGGSGGSGGSGGGSGGSGGSGGCSPSVSIMAGGGNGGGSGGGSGGGAGTGGSGGSGGGCSGNGGTGGGGAGGGIPLPGAGVVLDLIAGVVQAQPPTIPPPEPEPQPPATPPTDTPLSDTLLSASDQVTNLPLLIPEISTISDNNTGPSVISSNNIPSLEKDSKQKLTSQSGNTTISVPGEGTITLSYSNLISGDNFVVSTIKTPAELESLKITYGTNKTEHTLMSLNGTRYSLVGTIFNIGPNDVRFNETVTVNIPYNSSLITEESSLVRMFQYTGSTWEDVTTSPPANGHSVSGSISTVGPVVAAVKSN